MMLGRLGAHPETLRARGSAAGRSTRRLARVWEGGRGQDSVALTVVAAGARAAGRPPPGSPGLPPHGPASRQGAWVSDTSSGQRRSAWRPGHTSGTPQTPWPCPWPSAARNGRSPRSDTHRWPRNPPGVQRSEASGPEACSMPTHPHRQGVTGAARPRPRPTPAVPGDTWAARRRPVPASRCSSSSPSPWRSA